jgi:hypothetical protein
MIDTSSEEWRKECEAREILTWSLDKRRKHLALVADKRGWQARYYLEEEITRLWNMAKNPQLKQESLSLNKEQSMGKPNQIELI